MTSQGSLVLSVLPDLPIPPTTGLHVRMLSNLRVLAALGLRSEVLYFSTEEGRFDVPGMAAYCDSVVHAAQRRAYTDFSLRERVRQRAGFLSGALLHRPRQEYPFSVRYDNVGAERLITDAVRKRGADIVVLPGFLLHYAPAIVEVGAAVVLDAIDVISDLSWGLFKSEGRRRPSHALGLLANWLSCRSQERLFLRECVEVWATSDGEAGRIKAIEPRCNVVVVNSTFDEELVVPSPVPSHGRIGFIGTYGSRPNIDAAEYLAHDVFPSVLARCPHATLALAGAGMPPELRRRISALPHVEVLGAVADSSEFIRSCAVMALPVFVRGGVPLKLIEAMACGRPIVATPQLVAGVPVRHGRDVAVANRADGFAESVVSLLRDRGAPTAMGRAARSAFDAHFSLAAVTARVRAASVLNSYGGPRPRIPS